MRRIVGTIVGGVLLNSAIIAFTFFGVATGLLLLYKYRRYAVIGVRLFLSVSTLLFLFGGYVVEELLTMHDVPMDVVTYTLIMYNFMTWNTAHLLD